MSKTFNHKGFEAVGVTSIALRKTTDCTVLRAHGAREYAVNVYDKFECEGKV